MTGLAGAVEALVTVQVTNVDATQRAGGAPVRATAQATVTGSFQLVVPALLGDRLEIIAVRSGIASAKVETTAGPPISSVQLRIVVGDQQVGVVSRTLTDSFRVQATLPAGAVPGLAIVFESETPGGVFSRTRVVTSNEGTAASAYTLGLTEGLYTLAARLEAAPAAQVRGTARAVGPPQITSVNPSTMAPGDTVTVEGANFSPIAEHDVVRFGTERATVVSAALTSLRVAVPAFVTGGPVTVTLTGVSSNAVEVALTPAVIEGRALGEVRLQALPQAGAGQVVLPFEDASQEFTLVIQSLSTSSATSTVQVSGSAGAALRGLAPASAPSPVEGESYIREAERELLRGLPRGRAVVPSHGLTPAQDLGSTRQFWVVNTSAAISLTDPSNFDRVTATLRYKGDRTLLYVDSLANHTLTDAQLQELGDRYDDRTYPTDVGAFGEPSDIDGNGEVIILLSPTVNGLTTPEIMAQNARIVGFFFAIDLLPDPTFNPFANGAELFYGVVPNPTDEFTGARVVQEEVFELLSGVFAHEFQHMINFNQKTLIRFSPPEALWLDEGLAHMAESLNGFHDQNRLRSAFFLDSPPDVTLIAGGDDLDERGAAWLFVQYLVDRFGESILGRLVQTNLTSTTNVANAAARPFATLFHEWASTLLLDGPEIPNDPAFEMPSVDLRGDFELSKQQLNRTTRQIGEAYLDPRTVFVPGGALNLAQKGTSPLYVVVTSRGRANVAITISGQPGALLQVAVIRTR